MYQNQQQQDQRKLNTILEQFQQNQDDFQDQTLYDVLGVSKNATHQQIKNKYTELISHKKQSTEDQNQKYQEIQQAYAVLSNPKKRKQYDNQIGLGQQENQDNPHQNLLNMMFGGGHKQNKNKKGQLPKVQPTRKALQITLNQAYSGDIIEHLHKRHRICGQCKGKGGQGVQICTDCKGNGVIVNLINVGAGMYQQIQKPCGKCNSKGEIIAQQLKCKTCNGQKTIQTQTTIKITIQKGTPNNHPIKFVGEGDQIPNYRAGDLVYFVNIKQHQSFIRQGADLLLKLKLNLIQALTGFVIVIQHLDGKKYPISSNPNQIISDKQKKVIKNLGMPIYKDQQGNNGMLIIQFSVVMPEKGVIKQTNFQILQKILGGKLNEKPVDHNYELLEDFTADELNTDEEGGHKAQEQQAGEGQGVQCSSQ